MALDPMGLRVAWAAVRAATAAEPMAADDEATAAVVLLAAALAAEDWMVAAVADSVVAAMEAVGSVASSEDAWAVSPAVYDQAGRVVAAVAATMALAAAASSAAAAEAAVAMAAATWQALPTRKCPESLRWTTLQRRRRYLSRLRTP